MPIATSMKKVENPVTEISFSILNRPVGFTKCSVFRFVKKCDSITINVMAEPMAVASPAPYAPISHVKTKK